MDEAVLDGPSTVNGDSSVSVPSDLAARHAFSMLTGVAEGRGAIYRALARAFRDPDPTTVRGLVDGSFMADVDAGIRWLGSDRHVFDSSLEMIRVAGEQLAGVAEPAASTGLRTEYARLFIGPPAALVHPFASMYANGSDETTPLLGVGRVVTQVEQMYVDAGLRVASSLREPPDHIATEFEFLYYLCAEEAAAWLAGADEDGREWRRRQRTFVDDHLASWGGGFLDEVAESTISGYYRAMASLGRTFLRMEAGAFRPA